jgi:hypothetical protein
MAQLEVINVDDIRKLLLSVSPNRGQEVASLLDELNPVWLLDRIADRNLFQAVLWQPNQVRMGLKCSKRLQAHAYSAAVILFSIGKLRPERDLILAPSTRC